VRWSSINSFHTRPFTFTFTRHTTDEIVRRKTDDQLLTSVGLGQVTAAEFFGHLPIPAPDEDHHRFIAAALRPPAEWRRPVSRLITTLRTINDDLQSLNFAVHTAWRKARDRDVWHQVVSTATLQSGARL